MPKIAVQARLASTVWDHKTSSKAFQSDEKENCRAGIKQNMLQRFSIAPKTEGRAYVKGACIVSQLLATGGGEEEGSKSKREGRRGKVQAAPPAPKAPRPPFIRPPLRPESHLQQPKRASRTYSTRY